MPTTKRVRLTLGLIEQALRKPPPVGKTIFLRDSIVPGLALRVHPTGRATYTLLLPRGERKKLLTLQTEGMEVPEWWKGHLKKVREQAEKELLPYRSLESLLHQRAATRGTVQYQPAAPTKIEAVVRRFIREHLEKRTSMSYVRESGSRFRRFVLPAWKGRDVRSITRKDVRELVQGIERKGLPYPANRMLTNLKTMFTWCIENDLLDDNQPNPAQVVKKPGVERVRDHVLTDKELALVWHAACAARAPWGPWFRLLILTGQRRTEVASMLWSAVDLEKAEWTLSARQTKSRRAHVVPLSGEALNVLANMPRECPWVFTTNRAGPLSNHSFGKALLDGWLAQRVEEVEPWRIHDLRRTCDTGMARLKVPPHVLSAVLNHAPTDVNSRHYNQYTYLDEKREALDKWARHVLKMAERYQPAPTEEEVRDQERRQAMRRAWKREEAAARRQGKPGRPKTLEEANTLALAAMAETAARRR